MQLPADSFPYTPLKKIRSPKGQDQMWEVRCQKSGQMSDFRWLTSASHLISHIRHLLQAEVFHKRDAINLMKR